MPEILTVNGKEYKIIKLLGKGKGGYSYLAESDCTRVVLKQIHHEPCDYYTFGNKIEAERFDYGRLLDTGIRIPKMFDIDIPNERIVKEYIDGPTVMDLVNQGNLSEDIIDQAREMSEKANHFKYFTDLQCLKADLPTVTFSFELSITISRL